MLIAGTAKAGMGPCHADANDGLTCGAGIGAARVIDNTLSPDKRIAFAWRAPHDAPTEMPDDGAELDLLLVRLSDGAILHRRPTQYWDIGATHVNRLLELAVWSPASHWVARVYQSRFETSAFELFALGAGDAVSGPLDLRALIEPALRAQWKAKQPYDDYVFWAETDGASIDDAGRIHVTVLMWIPKDGPEEHFDVTVEVTRKPGGLRGRVAAIAPKTDKD